MNQETATPITPERLEPLTIFGKRQIVLCHPSSGINPNDTAHALRRFTQLTVVKTYVDVGPENMPLPEDGNPPIYITEAIDADNAIIHYAYTIKPKRLIVFFTEPPANICSQGLWGISKADFNTMPNGLDGLENACTLSILRLQLQRLYEAIMEAHQNVFVSGKKGTSIAGLVNDLRINLHLIDKKDPILELILELLVGTKWALSPEGIFINPRTEEEFLQLVENSEFVLKPSNP